MIQFRDAVAIKGTEGPVELVFDAEIRPSGPDAVAVVRKDGSRTSHLAKDVSPRPGFISLFARSDKGMLAALLPALLVPFFLVSLRWWILLRGEGFPAGLGRVFLVTYAGAFFNNFLPGAVGGDIAKALLASAGEGRKAAVVGTVILDRLVGLAVMIVMGAACFTPYAGRFEDPKLAIVVYGLFGGMVLGYLVYFSRPLRGWLKEKLPFRRTLQELDGVFKAARDRKGRVALAAGLSACSQGTSILLVYGLAVALGIRETPLWAFFVFEPVIFIVTAVPISLGGWGVQEGAYAYLFGTFAGMDPGQAVALSVLYKLCSILVTLPGGLLFAAGAAGKRPPPTS